MTEVNGYFTWHPLEEGAEPPSAETWRLIAAAPEMAALLNLIATLVRPETGHGETPTGRIVARYIRESGVLSRIRGEA